MKKISLILNIVLLAAVGYLYFLQFSKEAIVPIANVSKTGVKLVYVNADSLFENYDYYKDVKLKMEAKRKVIQSKFEEKANALKVEFTQYQQKAASLTPEQRQKIEQMLGQKQQDFMTGRDAASLEVEEQETKIHEALYDKIGAYLSTQSRNGYEIVFGYAKGGGILYANPGLNITPSILKGLNDAYAKEDKAEDKVAEKEKK